MIAILALPGLMCTDALWRPALDGVGRPVVSPAVPALSDLTAIAATLLADAPPRFLLVGHSMGGYIAYEMLRRAPERIIGVCLVGSPATPDTPEQTAMRGKAVARAGKIGIGPFAAELAGFLMPKAPALKPRVVEMAEAIGLETFTAHQTAIAGRPDSRPGLGAITVPVGVVVGDGDPLLSVEAARTIADAIPGAVLEVAPDCGHLLPIERPDVLADALARLIARTPERDVA